MIQPDNLVAGKPVDHPGPGDTGKTAVYNHASGRFELVALATALADGGAYEITTALDERAYPILAVANAAALPAPGTNNRVRFVLDELVLYRDNGTSWDRITGTLNDVTATNSTDGPLTTAADANDHDLNLAIGPFTVATGEVWEVRGYIPVITNDTIAGGANVRITDEANTVKQTYATPRAQAAGASVGGARPIERITVAGSYQRKLRLARANVGTASVTYLATTTGILSACRVK